MGTLAVMTTRTAVTVIGRRAKPLRNLRDRAWWCMRAMPAFGVDDLLRTVADGQESAARNNLLRFLRALECAGILVSLRQRSYRATGPQWGLLQDLGPLTPVVLRGLNQISDPNSGSVIDYLTVEVAHHG